VLIVLTISRESGLFSVQTRIDKQYINLKKVEGKYFKQTETDKFLLKDKEVFRIMPPPKSMGDNQWAYYHQTIGGYSPIEMYTIEEILENNVFNGWEKSFPVNWNILQMLNVKYVILPQEFSHKKLTLMHRNQQDKLFTNYFNQSLSRGFFIGEYQVVTDEYKRLEIINQPSFKPDSIALLEEELTESIDYPDSSLSRVTEFTPNKIVFDIFTDKQSLFVISELYYPPGWKIFIDGEKVSKIYKTDHALMSIIVPKGKHEIVVAFEPDSYHNNVKLSYASLIVIYISIAFSLVQFFRNKKE